MKIVVIGGTGLIGTQLCNNLRQQGHEVLPASPNTGVNAVTGEGLQAALQGADVVVDVANSPSFEDAAVLAFFEASGRNLAAAEKAAGVKHHLALSVVGTERMLSSGYFLAKMAQEKLIKESGVPYSILRATQFFEFVGAIAHSGTEGNSVRLPPAALQPIASADVAAALTNIAVQPPSNQTTEVAGPDRKPMGWFVKAYLDHNNDQREVIADAGATYFGAPVDDQSLTPGANPIIGATHFEEWLKQAAAPR
ncbi:LysR family transcriptional regulator [Metapseudomonas resinovorans]|uniref:SDR family oxidoreductase n=1 Tax=Metapseudomonas resinovorans TaxID=53412 RepID=UPI000985BE7D|nr:SDR family oxidoreductase [Pseudomonas resinovorans]GLZ87656.1 LysR family transcriptional regulator [Pseudomonas resinovorans]